jgi:hypothetical protein
VEVETLQQQQREEQVALTPGDPGHQAAPDGGILGEEGDRVDLDVGVLADLVGIGVVPGVLIHPPGVADADEHRGQYPADPVVRRPGSQDLAVRGLVAEEGELGEDQPERAGDQQLQPRVAQQDEPGNRPAEGHHQTGEQQQVEPARSMLQPEAAGGLRQRGERLGYMVRGPGWARHWRGDCGHGVCGPGSVKALRAGGRLPSRWKRQSSRTIRSGCQLDDHSLREPPSLGLMEHWSACRS